MIVNVERNMKVTLAYSTLQCICRVCFALKIVLHLQEPNQTSGLSRQHTVFTLFSVNMDKDI
jgi:hypothetical protein